MIFFPSLTLSILNFNSIKVRLELLAEQQTVLATEDFNSIKVRLERVIPAACATFTIFQFHKGTIRTGKKDYQTAVRRIFQFHKGTIRTPSGLQPPSPPQIFQFHKGTIRTKI